MKKQIFTILMFALTFVSVQAQDGNSVVEKGDFILNAGIGYLSPYSYATFTNGDVVRLPAVQVAGEKLKWEFSDILIGIGGSVGFQRVAYKYNTSKWGFNDFVLGVRGTVHFGNFLNLKKGDLYAGLQIGPRITTYSGDLAGYTYNSHVGLYSSLFVGARYFFKPKFGIFAEAGYDITWLKGGITMKF